MNDFEISRIAHEQIERLHREAWNFGLTRARPQSWRYRLARMLVRIAERLEP